jgi:predicted ATPase
VGMQEGLAAQRATGSGIVQPYYLALLAGIYGNMGRSEEGLAILAEASAMTQKTGEQWYEAELWRLQGELTLQKGVRGWGLGAGSSFPQAPSLRPQAPSEVEQEAEGYFFKAVEIAQKQQAKSLELRATMSLARFWHQQGRTAEASQMLAAVYGWFTEGFDTKDLQEAKALIGVLNH